MPWGGGTLSICPEARHEQRKGSGHSKDNTQYTISEVHFSAYVALDLLGPVRSQGAANSMQPWAYLDQLYYVQGGWWPHLPLCLLTTPCPLSPVQWSPASHYILPTQCILTISPVRVWGRRQWHCAPVTTESACFAYVTAHFELAACHLLPFAPSLRWPVSRGLHSRKRSPHAMFRTQSWLIFLDLRSNHNLLLLLLRNLVKEARW
jgi:hypothetical protein